MTAASVAHDGRAATWALPTVAKPFVSRGAAERLTDIVRELEWNAGAERNALICEATMLVDAMAARLAQLRYRANHPSHTVQHAESL